MSYYYDVVVIESNISDTTEINTREIAIYNMDYIDDNLKRLLSEGVESKSLAITGSYKVKKVINNSDRKIS